MAARVVSLPLAGNSPVTDPLQVLLVGGFSASPYLQRRAKAELTAAATTAPKADLRAAAAAALSPTVMTMDEPYAAVLQGTEQVSNWSCRALCR